ncbi:hypothetical protein [Goodfellowiella coeruleoviolacea]|uniref:Uncharacterized protein n=1 Tax=Goodfellowiella coeruleoviolacea TaxID=334858 RepID=A0AAE3GIM2_9PSEU|nr:hypothetical protein [Goodfellowiella coeruleoviolacea]MCP2167994.1 hypothetical protein [Goodfellowiella coeruleoviolacea]
MRTVLSRPGGPRAGRAVSLSRWRRGLALLGAALLLAGGHLGAAAPAAARPWAPTLEFQLFLDQVTKVGTLPGTFRLAEATLYDADGAPIGDARVRWGSAGTALGTDTAHQVTQVETTARLDDGEISYFGSYTDVDPDDMPAAEVTVTGGTGDFAGATGQGTVTRMSGGPPLYWVTLTLAERF